MIEFRFKPLGKWPRESTPKEERRATPFKSGCKWEPDGQGGHRAIAGKVTPLTRTYADLQKELRHLGVDGEVVLQCALSARWIRKDGLPSSGAPTPNHPGVILSFEAKVGERKAPLKFLCDDCRLWEDNLRAIALTLERLRLADLYGVTKSGEQYRGWAALPPGGLVTPPRMTAQEAAAFVALESGVAIASDVLSDAEKCRAAYRVAAKRHHADAQPGNVVTQTWHRLQEAKAVLDLHHEGSAAA